MITLWLSLTKRFYDTVSGKPSLFNVENIIMFEAFKTANLEQNKNADDLAVRHRKKAS